MHQNFHEKPRIYLSYFYKHDISFKSFPEFKAQYRFVCTDSLKIIMGFGPTMRKAYFDWRQRHDQYQLSRIRRLESQTRL